MNARDERVVVGVFQDRMAVDDTVDELRRSGFGLSQIGVLSRDLTDRPASKETDSAEKKKEDAFKATTGQGNPVLDGAAMMGAFAGASLGGLATVAIVTFVVPTIGPFVAGGALAALAAEAFGGAVAGAAVGTLIGGQMGRKLSDEDLQHYHDELDAGNILVTVTAGSREESARAVMQAHGAHDVHTAGAREVPVGVGKREFT
jgi:hypothetical protein